MVQRVTVWTSSCHDGAFLPSCRMAMASCNWGSTRATSPRTDFLPIFHFHCSPMPCQFAEGEGSSAPKPLRSFRELFLVAAKSPFIIPKTNIKVAEVNIREA